MAILTIISRLAAWKPEMLSHSLCASLTLSSRRSAIIAFSDGTRLVRAISRLPKSAIMTSSVVSVVSRESTYSDILLQINAIKSLVAFKRDGTVEQWLKTSFISGPHVKKFATRQAVRSKLGASSGQAFWWAANYIKHYNYQLRSSRQNSYRHTTVHISYYILQHRLITSVLSIETIHMHAFVFNENAAVEWKLLFTNRMKSDRNSEEETLIIVCRWTSVKNERSFDLFKYTDGNIFSLISYTLNQISQVASIACHDSKSGKLGFIQSVP